MEMSCGLSDIQRALQHDPLAKTLYLFQDLRSNSILRGARCAMPAQSRAASFLTQREAA